MSRILRIKIWLSKALSVLLIIVAASFATSEPLPARGDISLPFTTANGWPIVEAKIDGQEGAFILDTGSTITVVFARVGILATPSGICLPASANVTVTFPGKDQSVFAAIVRSDAFSAVAGKPIDGMVGMDVLAQYRVVQLDFQKHVITLTKSK